MIATRKGISPKASGSTRQNGGNSKEIQDSKDSKAWAFALADLRAKVSKSSYDRFLKTAVPISLDDETVVPGAPNRLSREWGIKNHTDTLRTLIGQYLGRVLHV